MHDCNPPTEWHARETYGYRYSPAGGIWNGTTWKAFVKWRTNNSVTSCCVNTDWGMGIISKSLNLGDKLELDNHFFEFGTLDSNRKKFLNLIEFEDFKALITTQIKGS